MLEPRFSVIIPTFNRATILPRALRSVLSQTERDFEVVVVDDGSSDATDAIVAAFDDPRVRYHAQHNAGPSAARNSGAALARGDFLVFLDSDDELLPSALELYLGALERDDRDVVLAGCILVSPDLRRWKTSVPDTVSVAARLHAQYLPGAFAIRRSFFAASGGYDVELRYSENTELGWRVRRLLLDGHGTIGTVETPLYVHYAGNGDAYDLAKYRAARRILEHRSYLLEINVPGGAARRRLRSTYLSICAVSAARLGNRREALRLALTAIAQNPTSLARYRALVSVARAGARTPRTGSDTATVLPGRPEGSKGAIHAAVVTFERPASLATIVEALPCEDLESLTVVDNAPSEASRVASNRASASVETTYLPMPANLGPAGGLAAAMAHVLTTANDDDWIVVLNDDGVPGSPGSFRDLRDFGEWLLDRGAPVGAVGLVGARFDRRSGRLVRPRDDELGGPVTVDYVAGNQLLMVRAGPARKIAGFDPDLFFGFEELDYCLQLQREGFGIYIDGPACLAERREYERLGEAVGRAPRPTNAWRRYYSVRNHIVIMRRYVSWPRAAMVTAAEFLLRPVVDRSQRRPGRIALARAGGRGCVDAWLGRLGRRVEPDA
jgi:glycosyltransferase involved in cell wall biosynthesis